MGRKCFTGCLFVMLAAVSCITRNNPFDPVNQHAGDSRIVRNEDTLTARFAAAQPGDTIIIAAGVYHASLRFTAGGTADHPIVVKGFDTSSIIQPEAGDGILFMSGLSSIRFSNIVFDSSLNSGAKVEFGSTDIVFDHCIFRNNQLDGLEIVDSDLRASNCVFRHNGRSGVRASGDASGAHAVTLENVLCAHNADEGISLTAAPITVVRATLSDNDSCGMRITTPAGAVRIAASVISFNAGAAVTGFRDTAASGVSIDSCDIFGNRTEFSLIPAVTPLYWTWDPFFTNRDKDDYSIGAASGVYAMEQQGVVIGYRRK
jgi:hypothetical protein